MAKVGFQQIPSGLDITYSKVLAPTDRFTIPAVRVKPLFVTRRQKKGVMQKSLIPTLKPVWNNFSTEVRAAWTSAALLNNMSGFNLFLKDTALRLKNSLSGYSTPSDLYQNLVGRLSVADPATIITIGQLHPQTYWVYKKIAGTRSQYEPVLVTENFALPLQIEISYKSDLVSCGAGSYARFYAIVYSWYQGRTIENFVEIDISLSAGWARATAILESVIGTPRGYNGYIQIFNARGDLFVDRISFIHSGHNWARDPYCNDIHQDFTKAFFQIPKNWFAVDLPEGAFFESFFYPILE